MKNIFKQTFTGLAFLSFTGLLFANRPAEFLKTGIGAKANGLGNAYSALVNDPGALYWNPAGLANIDGEAKQVKKIDPVKEAEKAFENDEEFQDFMDEETTMPSDPEPAPIEYETAFEMQINTSYSMLSGDRQLGFVGAAFTALGGTMGFGAMGTQISGIDGYDETGASTGELTYGAFAGYLGYAWERGASRLGVSAMGMQEQLGSSSDTINGGGINVGLQVVPIPILAAGVNLQNLVGGVQKNVDSSNYEKLDTILRFSLALSSPPPTANLKLMLGFTANFDDPDERGLVPNIGIAYGINKFTYFMLGLDGGKPSMGMGLDLKHVQVAYSVNRDNLDTEFQHFAEANFIF